MCRIAKRLPPRNLTVQIAQNNAMCRDHALGSLASVQMRDQALAAVPRYNRRDFEVCLVLKS